MFDLEAAIKKWKRGLAESPVLEDGYLEELEAHLRDKIADLTAQGADPEAAFREAVAAVGSGEKLDAEFFKARTTKRFGRAPWQAPRFVPALLWNYLKIARRNFRKQKGYSLLNIFGLALGMACSILIGFYIHHEMSYDRFHKHADRIFRVWLEGLVGDHPVKMAVTANPLAPTLSSRFPEVQDAARIRGSGTTSVKYADREFLESGIVYADPGLFKVFTFPLILGDAETALDRPQTVVLTERAARKYFGTEDPIGKFLKIDNRSDFAVTGVMQDVPPNSHLQFDLVCSLETDFAAHPGLRDDWFGPTSSRTYIRLDRPEAREQLEGKLVALLDEKMGERFRAMKVKAQFRLQPLTAIHLRSKLQFEFGGNGDILNIYILAAIAVIILAIASINFMNLATARSVQRAREVGLRKTLGASRRDLIGQFLAESVGFSLLALIAGLVLAWLAFPLLQSISGIGLALGPGQLAWLVPISFGLALVVGLVAGSYPALCLSSFQPVKTLKARPAEPRTGPGGAFFRRFLVAGQFTLSIFMISGTLTIGGQIRYMKNTDKGFQEDQVLAIRTSDERILRSLDHVKSRLKEVPGVLEVAAATFVPGQSQTFGPVVPEGYAEDETLRCCEVHADADYVRTMGMKIVQGRDFSGDLLSDSSDAILINETAVRMLGWKDPVGKTMKVPAGDQFRYSPKTVVGVVRDFHSSSLRNGLEPLYISPDMQDLSVLAVKIEADQKGRIVRELKRAWDTISPGRMFNFVFIDELFDAQYRNEERLNKLFSTFSLIAIAIACLGLFSLVSYTAEQRKKEVGIRKVLGATSREMVGLLCGDFLKLVGLAALIAWPIAYLTMQLWLRGFAYRTSIDPWTFVFSGLAALAIAFLTVSWQALRAASANPADSLKYE